MAMTMMVFKMLALKKRKSKGNAKTAATRENGKSGP